MHHGMDGEKVYWLHGKEIYIVWASLMQRLINDFSTLRPFMLLGSFAIAASSILIFFISRKLWGKLTGLMCYGIFVTSFWPYMYVMMAKHPPLGLLHAMLAICLLIYPLKNKGHFISLFLSGLVMGLAIFSSNGAPLYLPFYLAAYIYTCYQRDPESFKSASTLVKAAAAGLLVLLGMVTVFIYVNFPDVWGNFSNYLNYVKVSGKYNHFFYNQPYVQQWFQDADLSNIRGGWLWVIKYFMVIMPVLFPLYVISVVFLIHESLKQPLKIKAGILLLCFLSVSPMMMAEYAHVAQYGANYFPCIVGILFLVGVAFNRVLGETQSITIDPKKKRWGTGLASALILLQVGVNAHAFLTDVYPCRMVTTFLSDKMAELNEKKFYSYKLHPQNHLFVLNLTPSLYDNVRFVPIDYIVQPEESYVLVPPVTGDSIYVAATSTYMDFDRDVFLNELFRRGTLSKYAAASFKTIASSRYWLHEEEIMSYRRLILNHQIPVEEDKTRVWLLDAEKIQTNKGIIVPHKKYLHMRMNDVRNIGTKEKVYLYDGYTAKVMRPIRLKAVIVRIHKIGNPHDQLKAYIYKLDKKQEVLVPFNENYISNSVEGEKILSDGKEGVGVFQFKEPLDVPPGRYFFIIYRDGPLDDENYYRIHKDYLGLI